MTNGVKLTKAQKERLRQQNLKTAEKRQRATGRGGPSEADKRRERKKRRKEIMSSYFKFQHIGKVK